MEKEDYIAAIEKLNSEYMKLYYSDAQKSYRTKRKKRKLLEQRKYKLFIKYNLELTKKKFQKIKNNIKSFLKKIKKKITKFFEQLKKRFRKINRKIRDIYKKTYKFLRRVRNRLLRIVLRRVFRLVKNIKNRDLKKKLLIIIDGNKVVKRKKLRIKREKRLKESLEEERLFTDDEEENKDNQIIASEEINENNKNLDAKRKVVYTCIVGGYDNLNSPLITSENTDYIVYSDNKFIIEDTKCWEYRPIPDEIKEICDNNNILINRYIKMHPHILFPEYDYALYIDGNVRIISETTSLFDIINDITGIAIHAHNRRKDVYEEAEACIKVEKGNAKSIKKQINKYREEGVPEKYGLYEANVIASNLKNENAGRLLDFWWDEFIKSNTLRDQIILPYILWKSGYNYSDIGCLGTYMALNPKFRRYDHDE